MANVGNLNIPKTAQDLFDEAEATLETKLLNYSTAAKDSLELTDMNLFEKALVASSLHHGFVNCLFSEKRKLNKLKDYREAKVEEFISKFGQRDIPRYEIQSTVEKDKDIIKIDDAITKQQEVIRYLEEVCNLMKGFGYNIKHAVEMAKLTNI
jgi:hypothetical protein